MHIPKILPDECSQGFLGRLCRINDNQAPLVMRRFILQAVNDSGDLLTFASIPYLIAKILGCSIEQVVREHTFIPYARAINASSEKISSWSDLSSAQIEQAGMVLPGKHAHLCEQCIEDDRNFWGIPYWRRSHQLHGVLHCQKHGKPLHRVKAKEKNKTEQILLRLTNECNGDAERFDPVLLEVVKGHSVIKRYEDICQSFLENKSPIHPEQAKVRLAAQAHKLGLRIGQIGTRKLLSDLIGEKLPAPWLQEFFPLIINKKKGEFVRKIDGVCVSAHTPYKTAAYALALAVLWEDADEALAEFYRPLETRPSSAVSTENTSPSFADINLTLSINEPKLQPLQKVLQGFIQGLSLQEACVAADIPLQDAENMLRIALSNQLAFSSKLN